jgi:hypothetical protein
VRLELLCAKDAGEKPAVITAFLEIEQPDSVQPTPVEDHGMLLPPPLALAAADGTLLASIVLR